MGTFSMQMIGMWIVCHQWFGDCSLRLNV